jgi:hypothetical protein
VLVHKVSDNSNCSNNCSSNHNSSYHNSWLLPEDCADTGDAPDVDDDDSDEDYEDEDEQQQQQQQQHNSSSSSSNSAAPPRRALLHRGESPMAERQYGDTTAQLYGCGSTAGVAAIVGGGSSSSNSGSYSSLRSSSPHRLQQPLFGSFTVDQSDSELSPLMVPLRNTGSPELTWLHNSGSVKYDSSSDSAAAAAAAAGAAAASAATAAVHRKTSHSKLGYADHQQMAALVTPPAGAEPRRAQWGHELQHQHQQQQQQLRIDI